MKCKIKTTSKNMVPPTNQLSPTSTSALAGAMRNSLRIASESQKENISVTYDLAIAKLAMQIPAEEKPTLVKISIPYFCVESSIVVRRMLS